MEELRDIQGLLPVSVWPLAVGWWVVLALCSIILIATLIWLYKRYRYLNSWQGKSFTKLKIIANCMQGDELKSSLQLLSTEIRYIAMQSSSRVSCASLPANKWLQWLETNDPRGFAWTTKGQVIVDMQYAPQAKVDSTTILEIIAATKEWVRKC